ncbi:MAG: hypothetical protein Kow0068_08440 [Marinilabiliales bacterium]
MKRIILFLLLFPVIGIYSQEIVTFPSEDGLTVTAYDYEVDPKLPYIVLFHQARSSKGEYKDIAIKLLKLGYNCLAVDLRSGESCNYVPNETASLAKQEGKPTSYLDAKQDIKAAIDWAYKKSNKDVIIFGSSYSASLSLIIGKDHPHVKAVVAFSPGEYFKPQIVVQDELKGFTKPVFVTSSLPESKYITELMKYVPKEVKTIFQPQGGEGEHGAKCLWKTSETSKEYWLALMLFFKQNNL